MNLVLYSGDYSLFVDHLGLEEAPSRGVGTDGNHTSLSPINGMASKVSVLLELRSSSPLLTALRCSLRRCVINRVLPVCPKLFEGS